MMEDEWQNRFSGVIERNRYAFENSKFSDVEFSVGGTQEAIQAHKYMLAISSPVFEAMFYGPLAETTRIINIPDCTKEGLREMIRYIYTDEASITGNNVIELNYLARKYSILSLETKCDDFMYNHVEPEDVLLVLPHVQKLQKRDLEERCWSIIDKDTKRVFESQAFLDISRELLCRILSRDTLQIKELELFQAADRWVCKKIKDRGLDEDGDVKRGILGDELVRLIRFPTMKMNDFIEHVLDSEILQKGELTEVLKRFTFLEPSTSVFNTTPRSETPKSRPRLSRRYLSADSDSDRSPSPSHSRSRSRSRSRNRSRSRSRSHSRSLSPIVHQFRHRQNRSRNRRTRSRSPNRGLFRRRSIFE